MRNVSRHTKYFIPSRQVFLITTRTIAAPQQQTYESTLIRFPARVVCFFFRVETEGDAFINLCHVPYIFSSLMLLKEEPYLIFWTFSLWKLLLMWSCCLCRIPPGGFFSINKVFTGCFFKLKRKKNPNPEVTHVTASTTKREQITCGIWEKACETKQLHIMAQRTTL